MRVMIFKEQYEYRLGYQSFYICHWTIYLAFDISHLSLYYSVIRLYVHWGPRCPAFFVGHGKLNRGGAPLTCPINKAGQKLNNLVHPENTYEKIIAKRKIFKPRINTETHWYILKMGIQDSFKIDYKITQTAIIGYEK